MTWRRLRVIIQHLPAESHTMTALRNDLTDEEYAGYASKGEPEKARWSQIEQLLAAVVDSLRRLEYVTVLSNLDSKARKPAPPEPLRRPGMKAVHPKPTMTDRAREALFRLIKGQDAV
jgi:hypothetical protein